MRRTWMLRAATCTAAALGATTATLAGSPTTAALAGSPTTAALAGGAAAVVGAGSVVATAAASTGGIPLNVRSGPGLAHDRTGTLPHGSRLAVVCQVRGQDIAGYARRTNVWHRLAGGRYVSDANVAWSPTRPAPRWCTRAGGAPATVRTASADTGGIPLNLRAGPSVRSKRIGTVRNGARIAVLCQVSGQRVAGQVRSTDLWDRLTGGQYVSDAYLRWRPARPAVPDCASLRASGSRPGGTQPGAPDAVAPDPAAFIARVAGPARASMKRHGVPASVTIAQAILESGWGRSELAYADHNYFGIKCFGGPGPEAIGCRAYPTSECAGQRCFATTATFRVYPTLAESVRDHGRFLAVDNPRYRPAFAHTRAPDRFTAEIHRAGYATSPGYSRAIISLMRQYNLYRYNR